MADPMRSNSPSSPCTRTVTAKNARPFVCDREKSAQLHDHIAILHGRGADELLDRFEGRAGDQLLLVDVTTGAGGSGPDEGVVTMSH